MGFTDRYVMSGLVTTHDAREANRMNTEHLTRLKAAGQAVVALTERAEQATDQTDFDAALYELVDAVQEVNGAYNRLAVLRSASEDAVPSQEVSAMPDTARLAELIAGDFYNNQLDLSDRGMPAGFDAWSSMPEVESVKHLRACGTSDRSVRLFVTFVAAMDRARDSTQLWRAGVKLFASHPEVFDPGQVVSMPSPTVSDLLRASGVSQRHGPDAKAWCRIADSLASRSGAVCRVVEDGMGDAEELREDLQSQDRAGRDRFPMLCGPKVGPMWVRIMANPGGAQISRIASIPVAVDVHVRRVTENLGVTATQGLPLNKKIKQEIQSAWHAAVEVARIGGPCGITDTCAALDPALWFFGKHGCGHCEKMRQRIPISRACHHCQLYVR